MDLNKLLSYSVDSGASDLHLSVGSIPMVRINGTMKPLNMEALKQEDMESILPQVLDVHFQGQLRQSFLDACRRAQSSSGYHSVSAVDSGVVLRQLRER